MKDTALSPQEEIRVIALDFASKLVDYAPPGDMTYRTRSVIESASKIESYIREGTNGQ